MSVQLKQIPLVNGVVVKRPSKNCKSPYVADVIIDGSELMCHSPALGCCGLSDTNSCVLLSKIEKKNTKQVCEYKIELSHLSEGEHKIIIGINPKLAEEIAESALINNCVANLTNVISYKREITIMNSRFDFAGIDNNDKPFVMEIKNVPLADYVDVHKKDRKKYDCKDIPFNEKISYFPDGYRKKTTDVVSPRALKHIEELEKIAQSDVRAILCFVIQRNDVKHFQTSNVDLIYKEAVYKAWKNGVEINTIQVEWNQSGICNFIRNDLPISLKDGEFI